MSLSGQNHTSTTRKSEFYRSQVPSGVYPKVKHVIDFVLALIGFVVLLPVFVVLAVILALNNRGTPFFVQKRPGLHEKPFSLIKFKTMNDAKDEQGRYLPDEVRLTRVGAIIRGLSLDEIPQLLNVLRGEMSLIGPRPLLMEYLTLYNDFQRLRHGVRPGITGLSQVSGRNSIDWPTRFELDVYYVKNLSFWMDAGILFRTVSKVVRRDGINQDGHVTMSPFEGNSVQSISKSAQ